MRGWIRLHRSILEHWVWISDKHTKRWIDLIFLAGWEDRVFTYSNGKKHLNLKRGQMAVSIRFLQKRWNTNASMVLDFLKTLKDNKMIKVKPYTDITVITICNYEKYQSELFWEDSDEDSPQTEPESREENEQKIEPTGDNLEQSRERTWEPNKEIEENKKENSSSLSPRELEENYFEKLFSEEEAICQLMEIHSIKRKKVLDWMEKFKNMIFFNQHWHDDFEDAKSHFYSWLDIRIDKERKNETEGTKQQGGAASATVDRYAARRGTDVTDKTAADYGGTF